MNNFSLNLSQTTPSRTRRFTASTAWTTLIAAMLVALPCGAWAHPGHGLADEGWSHYLYSPYHWLVLLAMGTMLFLAGRWARRRLVRRCLQWGGAALAIGSIILLSLHV